MKKLFVSMFVMAVACVLGCGGAVDPNRPATFPVSGTVTQAGQPVAGASVTFQLADGSRSSIGLTDDAGKYSLTTFEPGDGAVAGEYQVTITKSERPAVAASSDGSVADTGDEPEADDSSDNGGEGDDEGPATLLPEKYADPETSGLTATVSESGENTFDFTIE